MPRPICPQVKRLMTLGLSYEDARREHDLQYKRRYMRRYYWKKNGYRRDAIHRARQRYRIRRGGNVRSRSRVELDGADFADRPQPQSGGNVRSRSRVELDGADFADRPQPQCFNCKRPNTRRRRLTVIDRLVPIKGNSLGEGNGVQAGAAQSALVRPLLEWHFPFPKLD